MKTLSRALRSILCADALLSLQSCVQLCEFLVGQGPLSMDRARILEWVPYFLLQGIFLTCKCIKPKVSLSLLHGRPILDLSSILSPFFLGELAWPLCISLLYTLPLFLILWFSPAWLP